MQEKQLVRLRWAVRVALALGIAASVAANILHAHPNPISRTISAWPPVALLVTVELTSRIPVARWYLAVIRILATTAIAGIAAWVSYFHMAATVFRFGEDSSSAHLLPVTVDGLIVVASVSLVEIQARLLAIAKASERVVDARPEPVSVTVAPATVEAPAAAPVVKASTAVQSRSGAAVRRKSAGPQGGLSGPQVTGPSKPGLNGRPLMEEPTQV